MSASTVIAPVPAAFAISITWFANVPFASWSRARITNEWIRVWMSPGKSVYVRASMIGVDARPSPPVFTRPVSYAAHDPDRIGGDALRDDLTDEVEAAGVLVQRDELLRRDRPALDAR